MPNDDANPWDEPEADAPAGDSGSTTSRPDPSDDGAAAKVSTAKEPGPSKDAGTSDNEGGPDTEDTSTESSDGGPAGPAEATDDDASRNRVLIIAAAAFLIIAALGFVLTRGSDDDSDRTDRPNGAPTSQPGNNAGPSGDGGAATISGTNDTFNRDDADDLGAMPNGTPWVVHSGGWGIRNGEVAVLQTDGDKRAAATIGSGFADPRAQVRLTKVVNGAGLVFRYQGECNYWAVYAIPDYATWNVEKVVDCVRVGGGGPDAQVFRSIPQSPVADGTTVGVILDGDKVQIVLNGRVATSFEDPALAGVGRVGVSARGPLSNEARFDDFIGGGPNGQGVVASDATPGSGGDTPAEGSEPDAGG